MLSYIYNKQLPAKVKAAKLFLSALMSNNLVDSYTSINLTEQVIKDSTYLWEAQAKAEAKGAACLNKRHARKDRVGKAAEAGV
jgi:hypothetical protein